MSVNRWALHRRCGRVIVASPRRALAGAIRLVSVERGDDPAHFVAMPFGGGGALHAGALIREIGLKAALVPRVPRHHLGARPRAGGSAPRDRPDAYVMLDGLDVAALKRRMTAMAEEARAVVVVAGIPVEATDRAFGLDTHYVGESHTPAVPLQIAPLDHPLARP